MEMVLFDYSVMSALISAIALLCAYSSMCGIKVEYGIKSASARHF